MYHMKLLPLNDLQKYNPVAKLFKLLFFVLFDIITSATEFMGLRCWMQYNLWLVGGLAVAIHSDTVGPAPG